MPHVCTVLTTAPQTLSARPTVLRAAEIEVLQIK